MATTGFWPVKGRLKDVINYAENPDKTTDRKYLDDDLAAALNYVENSDKTDQTMYVSGINCPKKRAYEAMMTTKRRFGKIGFGYGILPCIILLTGLYVIIRPMDPPAMAMLILGWCTLVYGVTELINALKIHNEKRKFAKAQEIPVAEEIKEEITEELPVEINGNTEEGQ